MNAIELAITRLSGSDLADRGALLPPSHTPGTAAIQVWVLDDEWLGLAERMFATTLSIEEQRRGATLARQHDGLRFRARRGLLRHLLSRYLGCRARDLQFLADAHGKPVLSSLAEPALQFNAAQTDGATVLTFAGAEVGVDVQCRRPELNLDDIAAEVLSTSERSDLQSATREDRARCFFDTWVRKEALLKALGIGLLADAKQYTTQACAGTPRWRAWRGDSELRGWTLFDLQLGNALHAAVAVQPRAA